MQNDQFKVCIYSFPIPYSRPVCSFSGKPSVIKPYLARGTLLDLGCFVVQFAAHRTPLPTKGNRFECATTVKSAIFLRLPDGRLPMA